MSNFYINQDTISAIKRHARQLKKSHPKRAYAKCLDLAAKEIAKVRDFHEATIRSKRNKRSNRYKMRSNFTGSYIPEKCPKCTIGNLVRIDYNTEEMTEGQFAEYLAETWGTSVCDTCGHEIDWNT